MMDVFLQPEMEMVARGLEKHLKVEQRELLLNMFAGVCGEESHRSATEALGLVRPYISLSCQIENAILGHLLCFILLLYTNNIYHCCNRGRSNINRIKPMKLVFFWGGWGGKKCINLCLISHIKPTRISRFVVKILFYCI
jgi:hypothetical protein